MTAHANGVRLGIYAQPEVGALCWVCKPSTGRFAAPFVAQTPEPARAIADALGQAVVVIVAVELLARRRAARASSHDAQHGHRAERKKAD